MITRTARLVASLLLGLVVLGGCPGELPRQDGRQVTPPPDLAPPARDWPVPSDQTQPWLDGYVSQPFGCARDGDCFGQRCCLTPWGVKLCMATCPL